MARRMAMPLLAVLGLGSALLPMQARAADGARQQQMQTLLEALRAFDQGSDLRRARPERARELFTEAAQKFQSLVDASIHNGMLYYNLANSYLQIGQVGRAILCYRRAEKLIPGDGRLESNLAYARQLRSEQISTGSPQAALHALFFWHFGYPLRLRFAAALIFYLLFWFFLSARLVLPQVRWGLAALPCGLLWLTLGASAAVDVVPQWHAAEGVILADNVIVRRNYGEGSEPQFEQPVHEGLEFTVLERRNDWLHIELPDGQRGWIREREAAVI